jgi:hypothetical protein
MSSSRYSGDGRKDSHRFFRVNDDDISVQEVFKNKF